jgi:hypothetical protein
MVGGWCSLSDKVAAQPSDPRGSGGYRMHFFALHARYIAKTHEHHPRLPQVSHAHPIRWYKYRPPFP